MSRAGRTPRTPMLPLLLAALANVIGFGVIVPLLPFFAGTAGATPQQVAWLFASFSLAQFLTAPLWGWLSDRVGRKPVILFSFAGSAATYIWLANAGGLTEIFAARILGGMMNGWLATSHAYIADTTAPDQRARGMGFIGAAFGVGFVIGPALGGYLVGGASPNFQLPILVAAAGSLVALTVALVGIREPVRRDRAARSSVRLHRVAAAAPIFAVMLGLHFCLFFVFSGMESVFALWCERVLAMGPRQVGYYLAFAGLCSVFVQGWLVGRLVGRFGEPLVFCFAVVSLAAGLALLPTTDVRVMLLPPLALLSIGFGLANPSLLSMMSRAAPDTIRGGALGLSQSAASLGRILGPAWAGFAFAAMGVVWPFYSGALVLGPVLVLSFILLKRFQRAD